MREQYLVDLFSSGALEYRDGEVWRITSKDGKALDAPQRIDRVTARGYRVLCGEYDLKSMAHRVIWILFNGPIQKGYEINHKNGDKADNRIENLELVTHRENILHAYHVLGRKMGSAGGGKPGWRLPEHPTWEEVLEIRNSTEASTVLAKRFGIGSSTVRLIRLGKRRKTR